MEKIVYVLQTGTHLMEREEDLALFNSLGHHVYIKSSLVDQNLETLCEFLHAPRGLPDIQQRLSVLTKDQLQSLLNLLTEKNLVVSYESSQTAVMKNSFLSSLYGDADLIEQMEQRIQSCQIHILNLLDHESPFQDGLRQVGFQTIESFTLETLPLLKEVLEKRAESYQVIVYGDWAHTSDLEKWNLYALENKISWLLVLQDEVGGQVGPFFSGTDRPCFECLRMRKASFFERGSLLQSGFFSSPKVRGPSISWYLATPILAQYAATEIYKLASQLPSPKIRRGAHLIDALNVKIKYSELIPVAFCRACSDFEKAPLGMTRSQETL